jgi:succinyl-diaminopimelate desuccinylase
MSDDVFIRRGKQLIAIPSVAGNPAALQAALAFVAEPFKKRSDITIEYFSSGDSPSLLAYAGNQRPERFSVVLNAHLDVVPASTDMFRPRQAGGRLYGRGALDMKLTALIMAEVFADCAAWLPPEVGLQLVTDEETGGRHGTAYQLAQGVAADFVIAGESSAIGEICVAGKGIAWVDITAHGKAAHSAYPWKGSNALVRLTRFITKLDTEYPQPNEEVWRTTVNYGGIHTPNEARNSIPDSATVQLDFRFVPGDPNFQNATTIAAFLQKIDPSVEVTVLSVEGAVRTDPGYPMVQLLADAVRNTTGKEAEFIRKHGASDTRYYAMQGGHPVVYGLQGDGAHGPEEFVDLASIMPYRQTLTRFLRSLPGIGR